MWNRKWAADTVCLETEQPALSQSRTHEFGFGVRTKAAFILRKVNLDWWSNWTAPAFFLLADSEGEKAFTMRLNRALVGLRFI